MKEKMKKVVLCCLMVCFIVIAAPTYGETIAPAAYWGSYMGITGPLNYFSYGLVGQIGGELNLGFFRMALLGELGAGLGIPFLLEYELSGNGELYIDQFGLGAGYGLVGNLVKWLDLNKEKITTTYMRFSLLWNVFGQDTTKLSLFGQIYKKDTWDFRINNWGFGLLFYSRLF